MYPVKLYVYDLSKGLARQMSMMLVGKQIDGIWHTSIVYKGVEYYYGAGIQTSSPGLTHHGQPLEVFDMGETALEEDVVLEYLQSLKEIYRPENYDLFMHNCNNFSQDFCQFLVGKDIPKHISSLPQEVLQTPFGQMMRPMIEQSLRPITTAPSAPSPVPSQQIVSNPPSIVAQTQQQKASTDGDHNRHGVIYGKNSSEIQNLIKAKHCVAVFFTSSTCAPCRIAYPKYDELAVSFGDKCTFIKVDINQAFDVAQTWNINATPTFKTFIDGQQVDEWKGASPLTLEGNIKILIQMAFPPHPHEKLHLSIIPGAYKTPIVYNRIPPLDKIKEKLSTVGIQDQIVSKMCYFVSEREAHGPESVATPDLHVWAELVRTKLSGDLSNDQLFPLIDLFRIAAVDVRVSSWFAEEEDLKTFKRIILFNTDEHEYQVRLVTLQLLCNGFNSHLLAPLLCGELGSELCQLVVGSLLDDHSNVRLAASSLAFNIAAFGLKIRLEQSEEVNTDISAELAVALTECIARESESSSTLSRLMLALGMLLYRISNPSENELLEICYSLEAPELIKRVSKSSITDKKISSELLSILSRP
ncbi:PPPDE putative peptidase domain-containing protein [Dipodascopsis uninucleata]